MFTSQLYFPDALTAAIYSEHPDYAPHGMSPYHHGNDIVLGNEPDGSGLLMLPQEVAGTLTASVKLGIS